MLEATRASRFVPGSNLRGRAAGAAWLFLLPRLSLGRIVVVGSVGAATLESLCRVGREVVLVGFGPAARRRALAAIRRRGLVNARVVRPRERAGIPDGSAGLVVLASARHAKRVRSGKSWPEVARFLRSDGVVYLESHGRAERLGSMIGDEGWLVPGGREAFEVAPALGEVRAAAPSGDAETYQALKRMGLWGDRITVQFRSRARELPMRAPSSLARGRSAILAGFGVNGWLGRPPLYLREIAREAGLEIDGMRWGMAAPGLYLSNKVLLLLFDRSNEGPAYVVKVARDPSINPRLENEWRALLRLRELGFAKDGSVPEPAFYGTSGRLAVLGLGGIAGRRFTKADPAGPSVVGAVEWITELGATTVDPTGAAGPIVARELRRLLAHLVDLYAIDANHRSILAGQIDVIEEARFLPLVFQHGDPGAWNLLVRPSGEVSFLDWEAAEPNGMPLWDLFHLMRSFGVMAARADGARDALEGFGAQLLQDTPLGLMLRESTAAYCTRVGVAPNLVEPLFHMSWMHRALKEATRLVPGRLERGHYINLMRRCLDERERGPLRELFNIRSPVEG